MAGPDRPRWVNKHGLAEADARPQLACHLGVERHAAERPEHHVQRSALEGEQRNQSGARSRSAAGRTARAAIVGEAGGAELGDREAAGREHQTLRRRRCPDPVSTRNRSERLDLGNAMQPSRRSTTPAASHSASSMATIARAEPSQNNWPSVFSWLGMPWRATRAQKSSAVYCARAERAKCGLAEKKRSGTVPVLVKLHRPPPEIRILRPGSSAWSSSNTRRPRCPATAAHIMPAAPAPITTTSNWFTAGRRRAAAGR